MEQKVERQRSFRMPFNAEVICHVDAHEFQGTIRNLSVSGFFMETTKNPLTDSKCGIEIVINGEHSRLTIDNLSGLVKRCDEHGVGIEFDDLLEWVALVPICFHKIHEQLTN